MIFFTDTNGGNNATNTNPARLNYAPLQQLQTDLANNTVARYNWITPDQYNDMHNGLSSYKGLSGDTAAIREGDDFLSILVPQIMASKAYQDGGTIIIWNDETEGTNRDDTNHTIMEIVISSLAHPNVAGVPYGSTIPYSHSSDLRTFQEIFNVGPYLGDAANATDLSDLFAPGAIPNGAPFISTPEPSSLLLLTSLTLPLLLSSRRPRRPVS
jgi:hypothetical protein